jgi:hypothetical protein
MRKEPELPKRHTKQEKTIREVVEEEGILLKEGLNRWLDPQFMIALFLLLQGKEQDDSPNDHKS